ncbi:MAG: hypothetical protein LBD23_20790 [Oscillospiraceae bacterium]|jgi:hypothetical protein|nr:hypothetical protein [Oscillospiraceae bacterium]
MKVNKFIRKTLAVLLAVCMLVQLGGMSYAVGDNILSEVDGSIDCYSQLVANAIYGEDSTSDYIGIALANILCIFGHSWAQTHSITIEHRVWSTSPRCVRTTHRVDYCTRSGCNRMDLTLISQIAIVCC